MSNGTGEDGVDATAGGMGGYRGVPYSSAFLVSVCRFNRESEIFVACSTVKECADYSARRSEGRGQWGARRPFPPPREASLATRTRGQCDGAHIVTFITVGISSGGIYFYRAAPRPSFKEFSRSGAMVPHSAM